MVQIVLLWLASLDWFREWRGKERQGTEQAKLLGPEAKATSNQQAESFNGHTVSERDLTTPTPPPTSEPDRVIRLSSSNAAAVRVSVQADALDTARDRDQGTGDNFRERESSSARSKSSQTCGPRGLKTHGSGSWNVNLRRSCRRNNYLRI